MQPAEPLEEWKSPPFEPAERDGNMYARGAVDDKGQMWMHVKALESLMAAGGGKLPVNVRVIVEGEEEVGGEGIAAFVREHGDAAEGGCGAGVGYGDVCAGAADAVRGSARDDLYGDRGAGRADGSALRACTAARRRTRLWRWRRSSRS